MILYIIIGFLIVMVFKIFQLYKRSKLDFETRIAGMIFDNCINEGKTEINCNNDRENLEMYKSLYDKDTLILEKFRIATSEFKESCMDTVLYEDYVIHKENVLKAMSQFLKHNNVFIHRIRILIKNDEDFGISITSPGKISIIHGEVEIISFIYEYEEFSYELNRDHDEIIRIKRSLFE